MGRGRKGEITKKEKELLKQVSIFGKLAKGSLQEFFGEGVGNTLVSLEERKILGFQNWGEQGYYVLTEKGEQLLWQKKKKLS